MQRSADPTGLKRTRRDEESANGLAAGMVHQQEEAGRRRMGGMSREGVPIRHDSTQGTMPVHVQELQVETIRVPPSRLGSGGARVRLHFS